MSPSPTVVPTGLIHHLGSSPGAFAPGWRQVVPLGLSHPNVPHVVEIVPLFEEGKDRELRLESVCVAGGAATAEVIR